jgi:hypothetical protein
MSEDILNLDTTTESSYYEDLKNYSSSTSANPIQNRTQTQQSNQQTNSTTQTINYYFALMNLALIVFGTSGNIFTFCLLMRPKLRKNYSSMRYLAIMCIVDLFCLYSWNFSLVYQNIVGRTGRRIEDEGSIACRLFSFHSFFILQLSSWLICAVGFDRIILLISNKNSTHKKQTNTAATNTPFYINIKLFLGFIFNKIINSHMIKSVMFVSFMITFILFSLNIVVVFRNIRYGTRIINVTTNLSRTGEFLDQQNSTIQLAWINQTSSSNSTINKRAPSFIIQETYFCYQGVGFSTPWSYVHAVMYSLVPFAIILAQNTFIMIMAYKHSTKMKKKLTYSKSVMNAHASSEPVIAANQSQSNKNEFSNLADATSASADRASKAAKKNSNSKIIDKSNNKEKAKIKSANMKSKKSKEAHVIKLLLFLTVSFVTCTLPYQVIFLGNMNSTLRQSDFGNIIRGFFTMAQYIRHAANFLIYIFSSSIIKQEIQFIINTLLKKNKS